MYDGQESDDGDGKDEDEYLWKCQWCEQGQGRVDIYDIWYMIIYMIMYMIIYMIIYMMMHMNMHMIMNTSESAIGVSKGEEELI